MRVRTTQPPSSVVPSTEYTPMASSEAFRMCDVCLEWPQLLSGQRLRPVRNALSCVPTRAAIRDTLSCPTYRCTAGSTLVRNHTSVTSRTVREGFLAQTSSKDTKGDTQVWNHSSVKLVSESFPGPTTWRPTPGLIQVKQVKSPSAVGGTVVRKSLLGQTN